MFVSCTRASVLSLVLLSSGCTFIREQTGEEKPLGLSTTGLAAATGAVIGGGLGAIVGSTTGSAGGGLVIGTAAGAAVGGIVGAQSESQEKQIEQQNLRAAHQEELLRANKRRISEIKRNVDTGARGALRSSSSNSLSASSVINKPIGYRGSSRAIEYAGNNSKQIDSGRKSVAASRNLAIERPPLKVIQPKEEIIKSQKAAQTLESVTARKVGSDKVSSEVDLIVETPRVENNAALLPEANAGKSLKAAVGSGLPPAKSVATEAAVEEEATAPVEEEVLVASEQKLDGKKSMEATANVNPGTTVADDCSKADKEFQRAKSSVSDADKLFYLRRALRLCSSKANFHLDTGRVYSRLGRTDDAEYEFRQALDIEPKNSEAKKALSELKGAQ